MTSKGWAPPGYKVPKAVGDYMRLEDGANKFRVLSPLVTGYEYWNTENKPVRLREMPGTPPADCRIEDKGGKKIKHFWAFVVWNYAVAKVQILELTQSSIQTSILDLVENTDWGTPTEYDITVTRKGQKLDTEYTVHPSPHKPIPADAVEAFKATKIDLDKLFDGGDPVEHETPGDDAFSQAMDESKETVIE